MDIKWIGANAANYGKGREGNAITTIVLHWIVGRLAAADATFQDPKRVASAHYGIGGTIVHQYVKEEDTAYHAGKLLINRQSIGIEHEGGPDLPISEETYKTSIELVASLCKKYAIPIDRQHIRKHEEISATQCPGKLDIDRIVREVAKSMNKMIQIESEIFERLVTNSTERDEIRGYLSVPLDPPDSKAEKVKGVIEGYKNLATGLQRQLDQKTAELTNKEEQVNRIKQTYEASAKTDGERIAALEKAQTAWEKERELLKGQVDGFAKDKGALTIALATQTTLTQEWKTKAEQAAAGSAASLSLGDVLVLLFKKAFTIKLK